MKKILVLFIAFGFALAFTNPVFATDNESTPGQGFTVDDTNGNSLTFKFSPKVVGQYESDGTSGNMQWFSICTYHGGGENFYGTSTTDTVIYKKSRTTSQTLSDAGIPTTTSAEEGAADDPDTTDVDEEVPSAWTGWDV
jgi:hypothetical protein